MSLYSLYHYPLCPFSRQIRIILQEKSIAFELIDENYCAPSAELLKLNPVMEVPVLCQKPYVVSDVQAIYEYLEERHPERDLLGTDLSTRAQVRKIANWFNNSFYNEVTKHIINERLVRYHKNDGEPNSSLIRSAKQNIVYHLDYIEYLIKQTKWLAAETLTIADISAACHLSVLDYLGDMPWQKHADVKNWYALIKSRPSFRPLLADRIPGFLPVSHYENLDF